MNHSQELKRLAVELFAIREELAQQAQMDFTSITEGLEKTFHYALFKCTSHGISGLISDALNELSTENPNKTKALSLITKALMTAKKEHILSSIKGVK